FTPMTGPYHFETWSKSSSGVVGARGEADRPPDKERGRGGEGEIEADGSAWSPGLLVSPSPCLLAAGVSVRSRRRGSAGSSRSDIQGSALPTRGPPGKPPAAPNESPRCPGRNSRPSRCHSTDR